MRLQGRAPLSCASPSRRRSIVASHTLEGSATVPSNRTPLGGLAGDDGVLATTGVPDPGHRRRRDDTPLIRWQLEIDPVRVPAGRDPWLAVVREALDRHAAGDPSSPAWAADAVWRVTGSGPLAGEHEGPRGIAAYHAGLLERSGGTFSQRLLALQGSNGPIVTAHVRASARRGSERLDMPSLLVFELAHLRIKRVTELPGDQAAWDRFWRLETD